VAGVVLYNFFFEPSGEWIHRYLGYSATFWILTRVGLRRFFGETGHTNLGSYVVSVGIWILVLLLGLTGFLMGTDTFFGEEWLDRTHLWIARTLIAVVGLHFLGLFKELLTNGRRRPLEMILGRHLR
jgi:cytochrome b